MYFTYLLEVERISPRPFYVYFLADYIVLATPLFMSPIFERCLDSNA
jgi:hypothetical protein